MANPDQADPQLPHQVAPYNRDVTKETAQTNAKAVDFATGVYSFPNDLGDDHIPDSVAFYFLDLVTKDGQWVAQQGNDVFKNYNPSGDVSKQVNRSGTLMGQNAPSGQISQIVSGGAEAIKNLPLIGDKVDPTKAAKAVTDFMGVTDTYKQTGDVVRLMMPAQLQYNSSAGWQAVSASPSGMGLLADWAFGETKFGDVAGYEIAKIVSNILYDENAGVVEAATQKVFNPFVSQAFQSMARRQFRFDWTLTPKNQDELDNIHAIIQLFRYHMHPAMDASTTFLRFPSQLDIVFMVKDDVENEWLPKITTCIIKDFTSNYTPNGQWATSRADKDGAPYQFQISLTVEEIVPLIKTDILKGR